MESCSHSGSNQVTGGLYSEGLIVPNSDDPFPVLSLSPILEDCKGVFLYCEDVTLIGLELASGKEMYKMCVKSLNKMFLNNRVA